MLRVPATPGTEPLSFIKVLSFPETWCDFCCTGLGFCAPDGGAAGDRGAFLLCRDSAMEGRWVLRVPAVLGWGTELLPFTGAFSFWETWRGSCCAGLEPCAPDISVAVVGGLFLLCCVPAAGLPKVEGLSVPAVPDWITSVFCETLEDTPLKLASFWGTPGWPPKALPLRRVSIFVPGPPKPSLLGLWKPVNPVEGVMESLAESL